MANGDSSTTGRVEIEVAVRDSMSAALKQMGRELDELNRKAQEGSISGAGGLDKVSRSAAQFGEVAQRTSRSLGGMTSLFGVMSKELLGPVGVVAGLVAAAKSLDNFAVGTLQMQNFSRDTGIAADKIATMRAQLSAAGIDVAQTNQALVSVAQKALDMQVHGRVSQVYQDIARSNHALAEQMLSLSKQGDVYGMLKAAQASWVEQGAKGNEAYQRYIERSLGVTRTFMEESTKGHTGLVKEWQGSAEAAKAYHETVQNITQTLQNVWNAMKMGAILSLEPDAEKRKRLIETMRPRSAARYGTESYDMIDELRKGELSQLTPEQRRAAERQQQYEKEAPGWMQKMWPKRPGWSDIFKRQSMEAGDALPAAARPIMFSREEQDIERDSNKTLHDIYDLMRQADTDQRVGGGAAPRGLTFRRDISTGRRRSRGDGGDDEGGTGANEGTLAEQRQAYIKELESDPALMDFAIDAMQKEGGLQSNFEQLFNYANMRGMTIKRALFSGQYGPVTGSNRSVTGRISEKTRQAGLAALRKVGAGSNITDYATDQGMAGDPSYDLYMANRDYYRMHKVEGAWFSYHHERGRRWAARQRQIAEERAQIARSGGGFFNAGGQYQLAGEGGSVGGQPTMRAEREALRAQNEAASRAIIQGNAAAARAGDNWGNVRAEIEFLNVPQGVKTRGEADGVFKTLKLSRSPQAPLAGGGVENFNRWAYE